MQPVYMYHGVGDDAELQGADPHYAVTTAAFARHLAAIRRSVALATQLNQGQFTQRKAPKAPVITFDDGHVTNYRNAFPALIEAGMQAEFYINTAMVGRPHFVTWKELGEMAGVGMSIQSHGDHHVFFADLDQKDLRAELERSKKAIEDHLSQAVTVLAPPGGRFDRRTVDMALSLGYRALAVSRPGLWSRTDKVTVPRFPIYAHTSDQTVAAYKNAWSADTLRAVLRYRVAKTGQKVLGNQRYDGLRNAVAKTTVIGVDAGKTA